MENRPIGREKRVVSGGGGLKRSGAGLGKAISERNVKRAVPEDTAGSEGAWEKETTTDNDQDSRQEDSAF